MTKPVAPQMSVSEELLAEIARRLVAELKPQAIYLFGSQVYGTVSADSDVDLLITIDDDELTREDQDERGYRCLRGLFLPIELHFAGHRQFERRAAVLGSFEHEVRAKGRLLYAR